MVLMDAQWTVLKPLIEAGRPHRKTQHHDLRRTAEAISWRCQNGAKWRAVPAEYGPWCDGGPDLHQMGQAWRLGTIVLEMDGLT